MNIGPGTTPIGDYVCSSHSIDGEGQVRSIPAGTIVHINGIPFRTTNDTLLSGTRGNFCLANDPFGQQGESTHREEINRIEDSEKSPARKQEDMREVDFQPSAIAADKTPNASEIEKQQLRLAALDRATSIGGHDQPAVDLITDAREILKFLENG